MNVVINPTKCTKTSITASNKIAIWLSKLTGSKLVDERALAGWVAGQHIETAFVVNGMFGFCDFRDHIQTICSNAKEVVWIANDYAIKPPSFINQLKDRANYRRIANHHNFDGLKNHAYVDFNKLLHWNGRVRPYVYDGLFYYGAYRKDRDKSFRHWLRDEGLPIHVSSSQKNLQDFKKLNKNMKLYKANGDIRSILHLFQSSIYIEDEFSHRNLMAPANRFYEVTGAKTLMLYDATARRTLEHAGVWHEDFCVSNLGEVKERLKSYDSLRAKQIAMFEGIDFVKQLEAELLAVL